MVIQIVVFSFGIVLIIIGILRQIDWYSLFNKWYGNNPKRAKIYVRFGENEIFYDGDLFWVDDKWKYYRYFIGKDIYTVAVPFGWKEYYIRGRRKILVEFGSEYALPLCSEDVAIMSSMGSMLLSESIEKKLAVDVVQSVESHKGLKLSTIILILLAIAVVFVVWKYVISPQAEPVTNQPGISQNITKPVYSQEDLELIEEMKKRK